MPTRKTTLCPSKHRPRGDPGCSLHTCGTGAWAATRLTAPALPLIRPSSPTPCVQVISLVVPLAPGPVQHKPESPRAARTTEADARTVRRRPPQGPRQGPITQGHPLAVSPDQHARSCRPARTHVALPQRVDPAPRLERRHPRQRQRVFGSHARLPFRERRAGPAGRPFAALGAAAPAMDRGTDDWKIACPEPCDPAADVGMGCVRRRRSPGRSLLPRSVSAAR